MCLYPKLILNPKYKPNKKNGYNPPKLTDDRVKYVPIGCQKCMECKKQRSRNWQARLTEDIRQNTNGKFVTLTFSNESIHDLMNDMNIEDNGGYEIDNAIATLAVRRFLERWRKTYGVSLRHWFVTELGHKGTENIHLHGIIWCDNEIHKFNRKTGEWKETNNWDKEIKKHWQYGFVWTGKPKETGNWEGKKINYVSEKTINYIVKYVTKLDFDHKGFNSLILTSAGIGANYTKNIQFKNNEYQDENSKKKTNQLYRTPSGKNIALPIYWRNKRYTEEQREKLWIQRIDEGYQWICKNKVETKNIEEVLKLLKWYRKLNKELGYGDDEKNFNEEQYENQRRQLLRTKRRKNYSTLCNEEQQLL